MSTLITISGAVILELVVVWRGSETVLWIQTCATSSSCSSTTVTTLQKDLLTFCLVHHTLCLSDQ
uniref:Uncharacterized protein n=1 Tax=Magallana gigas TaxID=29159 RepID=K1P717_MAGGI